MVTSPGDFVAGVAVDSSGRIVAAGHRGDAPSKDGLVVRYTADGTLDMSFASGGTYLRGLGTNNDFHRLSVVAGDGILLLGRYGSPQYAYVARLDAGGAPDTTFGAGGFGDTVQMDGSLDMAVDADGNAVVGGEERPDSWLLARWCGA